MFETGPDNGEVTVRQVGRYDDESMGVKLTADAELNEDDVKELVRILEESQGRS